MHWEIQGPAAIHGADAGALQLAATPAAATASFAKVMQHELAELNSNLGAAELAMRELAAGKPVELHEVMIELERARLSVQTFVQVRNKLTESYQDLMRMQL